VSSLVAQGTAPKPVPVSTPTVSPRTSSASSDADREPTLRSAIAHLATKHGVWLSFGGSRGGADLFCDVCTQDPTYAWAMQASAGIRLVPSLLLGVETVGWFDVFGDANRTVRSTTLMLRSYSFGRHRPFLQGGAGVARYRVRDGEAGFRTQSPALTFGLGQDLRVGSAIVSPHVDAVVSVGGRLHSERTDNAIDPNARVALVRTGLTLSWFR
jgi:hypothetical protein